MDNRTSSVLEFSNQRPLITQNNDVSFKNLPEVESQEVTILPDFLNQKNSQASLSEEFPQIEIGGNSRNYNSKQYPNSVNVNSHVNSFNRLAAVAYN